MGFFAKIANGFQSLIIFLKSSILDIWLGSENVSGEYRDIQTAAINTECSSQALLRSGI